MYETEQMKVNLNHGIKKEKNMKTLPRERERKKKEGRGDQSRGNRKEVAHNVKKKIYMDGGRKKNNNTRKRRLMKKNMSNDKRRQ